MGQLTTKLIHTKKNDFFSTPISSSWAPLNCVVMHEL